MSDIKQEILFPKSGLNTDDSQIYSALADSKYRLNILVGEEGSNGVITNAKGNKLAVYPLNLSNSYQVVGSYYDQLTRKAYYWIYSQPYDWSGSGDYIYDNHLLEFDEDAETITNIFTDEKNYFGLDPWHPIKDADKLGNTIYFNTRISEPKMIDIVRAKNYMDYTTYAYSPTTYIYGAKVKFHGGIFTANRAITADQTPSTHPTYWDRIGDCYQDETDLNVFDSEFRYAFHTIRHIPVSRPICEYKTDSGKNANNVRGRLFRFTHRYKYFDNSYSLFGAYSDIVLPINDEYYNGEVPDDISLFNYIAVTIPLHSPALIKEIDIVFQETGGDWKRAVLINRWDQGLLDDYVYTYKFYNNDASYEIVSPTLFDEAYDSVPKKAGTQELINKNILTFGRCTEGFDNIDKNDIQVSLTPEIDDIVIKDGELLTRRDNSSFNPNTTSRHDWFLYWSASRQRTQWRLDIGYWFASSSIAAGDIFEITIDGVKKDYNIQGADIVTQDIFGQALVDSIHANYPGLEETLYLPSMDYVSLQGLSTAVSRIYKPTGSATVALTKRRGFKTGAWHPFCLYYYDKAMRRCDAQVSKENIDGSGLTIDGTTAYVPMFNECSPLPNTTAHKWHIDWEINHLPPEWAYWWRWGYAGNSLCTYFVQYIINTITDDGVWTKIDITPLQTIRDTTTGNQFPQSIIDPYVLQKGDRVRFITVAAAATEIGGIVDGVYDYEILKQDESTPAGSYYIYTQHFHHAAANIGTESLIEIYRPSKYDTSVLTTTITEPVRPFYEFGELMPIIEDSAGVRVHGVSGGGTEDQDFALSQSAKGTFDNGDIYHVLRTPSQAIDTTEGYFHESLWYSDFYLSDDYDKGRVGAETSFGERTLNIIRYSNQYMQNTGINGLGTFEGDHYKEITDVFGNIISTVEVGTTLKVYMQKKAASILIGRQEYQDAEGKLTTAESTVVLGSIRYPENNFGTQWIESVTKSNRYIYGFDVFNAVMWRDSANGIFPISGRYADAGQIGDYKMATWFKEKADALMLSGIENVKVISVFDERYKNLYVIFNDYANNINNEVIVYHEPSDRWICFSNWDQTPIDGYNEMLELDYSIEKGFENGIGYYFDEDTRFAVFNIPQTTTDITAFTDNVELIYTLFEPTFIGDMAYMVDLLPITLSLKEPTVKISYVSLSESSLSWVGGEAGVGVQKTFVITSSETQVQIINIADWITLNGPDGILSVGDYVANGSTVGVYPTSSNIAARSAGPFAIVQDTPFFDRANITFSQTALNTDPIVVVDVDGRDTTLMTISNESGTATSGSPLVSITFTPDRPLHSAGGAFTMYWQCTKNVGGTINQITHGTFVANEEIPNTTILTLTENVTPSQTITVDLSSMDIYSEGIVPPSISAPIVGVITQPTFALATGSVALSGLPASGTWIITTYPGVTTTTGTGTTTTITGLISGTYNFTVTDSAGTVSGMSSSAIVDLQPANVTPITDLLELSFRLFEPTVNTSFITLTVSSFTWNYGQAGFAEGLTTVIACSQPYATITNKASWITMFNDYGELSIGSVVYSGQTIRLYPTSSNTGAARTATFVLVTNTPLLDTVGVTVTQTANTAEPIATWYQDGGDTSGMIITDGSTGTLAQGGALASTGSPYIYISITPDHPDHGIGGEFTMYYEITQNVGGTITQLTYGSFTAYDEQVNNITLDIGSNATTGQVLDVNLSAVSIYP